mmetsp:Transcript_69318/g.122392  ORF Transcript_69318/g.122392 Transcript_69318/m.122392 type:complete len:322 (-) Transcript_69318:764-1729(-)
MDRQVVLAKRKDAGLDGLAASHLQDVGILLTDVTPWGRAVHAEHHLLVGEEPHDVDVREDFSEVVPGHPKGAVVLELWLQLPLVGGVGPPFARVVGVVPVPLSLVTPGVADPDEALAITGDSKLDDGVRMTLVQASNGPLLPSTPSTPCRPHVPTHRTPQNRERVVHDCLELGEVRAPMGVLFALGQVESVAHPSGQILKGLTGPATINAVPAVVDLGICLLNDQGPELGLVPWAGVLGPHIPPTIVIVCNPIVDNNPLPAPVLAPHHAVDAVRNVREHKEALHRLQVCSGATGKGTGSSDEEAITYGTLNDVIAVCPINE